MDEISKTIKVDEIQFSGLFIFQEDNMLVIASRPDWVRHPDGSKLYIKDMFVLQEGGRCPECGASGKHGVVVLENDLMIVCCTECKQFVWCSIGRIK